MEQKTDDSDTLHRQLEATLGIEHNPNNQVANGPIHELSEGWAKVAFQGKKAHYLINETQFYKPMIAHGCRLQVYRSKCGMAQVISNPRHPNIFHPGTYKRCKRCE